MDDPPFSYSGYPLELEKSSDKKWRRRNFSRPISGLTGLGSNVQQEFLSGKYYIDRWFDPQAISDIGISGIRTRYPEGLLVAKNLQCLVSLTMIQGSKSPFINMVVFLENFQPR